MATLSTLGQMMLALPPQIPQYDPLDVALTRERLQGGRTQNQTALLALEELQRAQESAALARQHYQANPQDLLGAAPGGASTLGQPGGQAPGPITHSSTLAGMPGAAQTVPAPQDLSRYAGVSPGGGGPITPDVAAQVMPTVTPPQSTLGAPGPQARAHPLEALMRQNPDAAMQVLSQQQKVAETRLNWRTKILDYTASALQGASDQASWDQGRQEVARVDPQLAAGLPPAYSAAARDRVVQQALSAKDKMTLNVDTLKNQIEARKLQLQAATLPNYTGDATIDAAIYARMKGQPPGTQPSEEIVDAARKDVQQGKVDVSAAQGSEHARQRALGDTGQKRLEAYDKAGLTAETTHGTLDQIEGLINSAEGVYGNSPEARLAMASYNAGLNPSDQRARNTAQLRNLASQLQLAHGSLGTGVSVYDAQVYAKAAGDLQNAQNVDQMKQYIQQMRPVLDRAQTRANEARRTWEKEGRLPEFGQGRQGTTGAGQGAQPAGGTRGTVKLETLADYAAKHNVPIGQVIKQAYEKGLEID